MIRITIEISGTAQASETVDRWLAGSDSLKDEIVRAIGRAGRAEGLSSHQLRILYRAERVEGEGAEGTSVPPSR